jgi:hypothetical protein
MWTVFKTNFVCLKLASERWVGENANHCQSCMRRNYKTEETDVY